MKSVSKSAAMKPTAIRQRKRNMVGSMRPYQVRKPLKPALKTRKKAALDSCSPVSRRAESTGARVKAWKSEMVIDAAIVSANCL